MANTKISQLPSYTGSAADLRWFVMNNSGETETFKYSGYTSPFKTGSVDNSATLIGYAGTNAGRAGVLAGGSSNSYANTANSIVWGEQCWVGDDQQYPSAVFGRFCRSTGSGNLVAGNNSNSTGAYNLVVGEGCASDTTWGISLGRSCSIDGGSYASIVAGNISSIQNSFAAAVFGEQNSINGSQYSAVLGGKQNFITSSSPYNAIVGSNNSSITGGTNVVMIGCSGRTGTASSTTYTENLHTYRTPSTQVQPISSGTTFTCNLDNGAKSQFYITGTSTINITNVRDGASFMIKTQTDGNYVMTWTATGGYTFVFEGGIKDPGNNVTDIFVFEVFGSVIYGNRRHNYS